jgi:hypothetical protein
MVTVLRCCMQYPSTLDIHQYLKYEVLEIPSSSPDLAALDYHMFGPLRDVLRGHHFSSDQQVK